MFRGLLHVAHSLYILYNMQCNNWFCCVAYYTYYSCIFFSYYSRDTTCNNLNGTVLLKNKEISRKTMKNLDTNKKRNLGEWSYIVQATYYDSKNLAYYHLDYDVLYIFLRFKERVFDPMNLTRVYLRKR